MKKINLFIYKFYLKFLVKRKLSRLFNKRKSKKTDNVVLVEFNKWTSTQISIAYVSSVLADKHNGRIYAYAENGFSKFLHGFSYLERIYIFLNKFFKISSYSIYSSFGVEKFIDTNYINSKILIKSKKIYNYFIKNKLKSKKDILNLKIEEVFIGDLIYDTYLRMYKVPTVDILDIRFKKLLEKSIIYFYFWDEIFKNKKIKAVVVSQAVYNSNIPIRIGMKYGCDCLVASPKSITRLTKKYPYPLSENLNFKNLFFKLSYKNQKLAISYTKKILKASFEKNKKLKNDEIFLSQYGYRKKSFISKKVYKKTWSKKRIIEKSSNFKVLICPHALSDAPHTRGLHLYPDFYEWLISIFKISNKTNYDWYLKLHPDLNQYWDFTKPLIKKLINNKYKNIKYIDNKSYHSQIIDEGINAVITCAGSVSSEYAYFNIPAINASLCNPHVDFSFSANPKSIKEFKKILLGLNKIKIKVNKRELLIYFFMNEVFFSEDWLFPNWDKIVKFCGGRNEIYREQFYNYWIKNHNKNMHNKSIRGISKFIDSGEYKLNFNHFNKTLKEQINSNKLN
jgi:hypothetical protein